MGEFTGPNRAEVERLARDYREQVDAIVIAENKANAVAADILSRDKTWVEAQKDRAVAAEAAAIYRARLAKLRPAGDLETAISVDLGSVRVTYGKTVERIAMAAEKARALWTSDRALAEALGIERTTREPDVMISVRSDVASKEAVKEAMKIASGGAWGGDVDEESE